MLPTKQPAAQLEMNIYVQNESNHFASRYRNLDEGTLHLPILAIDYQQGPQVRLGINE